MIDGKRNTYIALRSIIFPPFLMLLMHIVHRMQFSYNHPIFPKFGLYIKHLYILSLTLSLGINVWILSNKSHIFRVFEIWFMPIKSLIYLLDCFLNISKRTPTPGAYINNVRQIIIKNSIARWHNKIKN